MFQLTKKLEWKEVETITNIPSSANEVNIVISLAHSDNEYTFTEELRCLYSNLLKGIKKTIAGFYWDANTNGYADVTINANSISVEPKNYYKFYRIDAIYYR